LALGGGAAALAAGFGLRAVSLGQSRSNLARIAVLPMLVAGLARYAGAAGLMGQHGVSGRLIDHVDGPSALAALSRGDVEFATASDWATLVAAIADSRLRVVTELASYALNLVVARRDRGVASLQDLAGKRLAYAFGTLNDVLAPDFLAQSGLADDPPILVDVGLDDLGGALWRGEVDAALLWDVRALRAKAALGDRAICFPLRRNAMARFLLVTRADMLAERAEVVDGVTAAIVGAQNVLDRAPARYAEVVADGLDLPPSVREGAFETVLVGAGLGQTLLSLLEKRLRFARARGLIAPGAAPDVRGFIDSASLRRVAPEFVTVLE
jgi:ABC-type nitrate/sulfonate/bicarbonate transport system substrate-binding protein